MSLNKRVLYAGLAAVTLAAPSAFCVKTEHTRNEFIEAGNKLQNKKEAAEKIAAASIDPAKAIAMHAKCKVMEAICESEARRNIGPTAMTLLESMEDCEKNNSTDKICRETVSRLTVATTLPTFEKYRACIDQAADCYDRAIFFTDY